MAETHIAPSDTPGLRARRLSVGISIRDLEARSGIPRGRISFYERGLVPTIDDHAAIERVLVDAETALAPGLPCVHCGGAQANRVRIDRLGVKMLCAGCTERLGALGLDLEAAT